MAEFDDCGCRCHDINYAGEEPWCLCDNSYSNLCTATRPDPWEELERWDA